MKKTITKTTKYYDENGKITKEETETITEEDCQKNPVDLTYDLLHKYWVDIQSKTVYDTVSHDGITHAV